MNGYVQHLSAPVWAESGFEPHEIESPTWADIEAAVRALDGRTRNDVYLIPDPNTPESYLAVAGGAENRYLVFICHNNEQFDEAITPDAADFTVELVVGGQLGEFDVGDLVTLDQALEAARWFNENGRASERIHWRHRQQPTRVAFGFGPVV